MSFLPYRCRECGSSLASRRDDAKFCNSACRSRWHRQQKAEELAALRAIVASR